MKQNVSEEFYKMCFKEACKVCEGLDLIVRDKNNRSAEDYEKEIINSVKVKTKWKNKDI